MKLKIKLGTRKSLLAWAQSSRIARQVEKLNPGVQVELVGIETRGDKIQNIPLQQVEGKDFFVAELDLALQSGAVDMTVHSMKDLSLSRPHDLICAAIPFRENPRDVVLFGPQALHRLREGKKLRMGTSSPRRLENVPYFLERALPQVTPEGQHPSFDWIEIRGNVNTRLSRVHEAENSERYLDGVVLAFAGLIRLWADIPGRGELEKLLKDVRWMVLPLKQCPAAPAQGALAIECRKNDGPVQKILGLLHSPVTAEQVARERELLAEWGGGCHQRFGATVIPHPEFESMLFIRGVKSDGSFVEEVRWPSPQSPRITSGFSKDFILRPWDGSSWRSKGSTHSKALSTFNLSPLKMGLPVVFVAHSRALTGVQHETEFDVLQKTRVWTSGVASWYDLASKGVWVEGCAEGLGFKALGSTLKLGVLQLPEFYDWTALTHDQALEEWTELGLKALSTYKINSSYGSLSKSRLRDATHVFWSSGSQYDELKEEVSPQAHQACGPGKTAERLREAGICPLVFPSIEEWRKWLQIAH